MVNFEKCNLFLTSFSKATISETLFNNKNTIEDVVKN
jgi:hypothetical protein